MVKTVGDQQGMKNAPSKKFVQTERVLSMFDSSVERKNSNEISIILAALRRSKLTSGGAYLRGLASR